MNKPSRDMWDELSDAVPELHRELYWRTIVRLRKLPPDDEVVLLTQALGILTRLTVDVPKLLAAEREGWARQMAQTEKELDQAVRDASAKIVTASNAVDRAAAIMLKTASMVEASATTVRDGLRMAPSHISSMAIADAVARELETRLVKPAAKTVETMVVTVEKLPGFIQRAEKTMQFLKDFNITWHYVTALIFGITLAILLPLLFKGCAP